MAIDAMTRDDEHRIPAGAAAAPPRAGRTILVMAGGTGGHIYPALAVADHLRDAGWRIVWIGTPEGMESRIVPKAGYPLETVRFGGVRGKGWLTKALLPIRLAAAFWQSGHAIRRVAPDVVLGMGGYISFPGGIMAALLGRPLVIHEQNSRAGLANRVLARVARRVLTAFPDALPKGEHTGNPVRTVISAIPAPAERYGARGGRLRILVVGGSLGAQVLNEVIPKALALLPWAARPSVTHQAGEKNIEALRATYKDAAVEGTLVPFIEDMAAAYAEADLVICRAGATTVAEIAAAGVASFLVPYPYAVDDHQTANARYLSDAGAAVLVPQAELTPERLANLIIDTPRPKLAEMAGRARTLGRTDATARVAAVCEAVCERTNESRAHEA